MPSLPVLLITDSDVYDNTAGFLITGSDVTFAIYCFIIDFNLYFSWNRVSLHIHYVDDRYINIKHYKCYGYNSNILIHISIPQNKKEMFLDITHASWTSYNNLASRSRPYWSLYFMDCAMENTPSFSNTSAKMNFASSYCSATISMSSSLSCLYFLRCRSKKMISKEEQ